MPEPFLLTEREASAYLSFRHASLVESPWAFMSSPDDDRFRTVEKLKKRPHDPENVIVVVARDDDQREILASAGVVRETKLKARHRACVWGVYCLPTERGKGYGRAVVERAIETARSWPGVERLELSVSVHDPAPLALYESLGFKVWGREPDALRLDGRSFDELHMVLRLT